MFHNLLSELTLEPFSVILHFVMTIGTHTTCTHFCEIKQNFVIILKLLRLLDVMYIAIFGLDNRRYKVFNI